MRRIRRSPKNISEEDVIKIVENIFNTERYMNTKLGDFLRLRDAYAWLLINNAGLRPSECLNLQWSDIDFEKRQIKVSPYWNKQRIDLPAVLTIPAERLIKEYRDKLKKLGIMSSYLFPSTANWSALSPARFARIILIAAKECGVAKVEWITESGQPKYNIRPYTGRHNYLTKVYKATGSEIAVMKLARHLNQQSAQFYVHLDDDDKKALADAIFK